MAPRGAFIVAVLALLYAILQRIAPHGTALCAKLRCSAHFVAGRTGNRIFEAELQGLPTLFSYSIDENNQMVSVSILGLFSRSAIHRPGLGCTVVGTGVHTLNQNMKVPDLTPKPTRHLAWPTGDTIDQGKVDDVLRSVDQRRLDQAVFTAMQEVPSARLKHRKNTRAVLVAYKGQLIAEQYGDGFNVDTPLAGWSMTKSVTATLVGMRVRERKLKLSDPLFVQSDVFPTLSSDDPRRNITLHHALGMATGLEFNEDYNPVIPQDPVIMLGSARSAAHYASHKPLFMSPGSFFSYSSGTTNIISHRLRTTFATHEEYLAYPRRALFDRLGMQSAVMEVDAEGDFVGSSFMMATGRDWLRLGLLYSQGGRWEDKQVLPADWITLNNKPVAANAQGLYGLQMWRGGSCAGKASSTRFPLIPCDTMVMSGYEAQKVFIIPSHDLVIVRLGVTKDEFFAGLEHLVNEVVAAVSQR